MAYINRQLEKHVSDEVFTDETEEDDINEIIS